MIMRYNKLIATYRGLMDTVLPVRTYYHDKGDMRSFSFESDSLICIRLHIYGVKSPPLCNNTLSQWKYLKFTSLYTYISHIYSRSEFAYSQVTRLSRRGDRLNSGDKSSRARFLSRSNNRKSVPNKYQIFSVQTHRSGYAPLRSIYRIR